jgi:exosortase/archaeosortase family protein
VLTDTARRPTDALRFVAGGLAVSLGLFGVLRLGWIEAHALLPLTRGQATLAGAVFGAPALPVEATLACSGADALALCLAAVLAYPVAWRARLAGAGAGVTLILLLNTVRIGTLGRAAASPYLFNALHYYVWPALLTLAIAGYVLAWMRLADRRSHRPSVPASPDEGAPGLDSGAGSPRVHALRPSRRFVVLTIAFVLLFSAAGPLYLESAVVLAMAGFVARAAAAMLGTAGVTAHAAANVLWTSRGGFMVTQECISTPLIPVYLAAICAYAPTWRRLLIGVAGAVPLFLALGILRLLVVALPSALSPLFFVHAFYQLLLGGLLVVLAALWRRRGAAALGYAIAGMFAGCAFAALAGPLYTRLVLHYAGAPAADPQGAIALLPAFQGGLYLALGVAAVAGVGWRRFAAGFAVLVVLQTVGLAAWQAMASHANLIAPVPEVRALAIVVPVVIFGVVANVATIRR